MTPAAAKPAKTYTALRAFSYIESGEYIDVAEGAKGLALPPAVVKDLQTNHGEPVLAEADA